MKGLKLPAGYFGPPSSSQPFFVFEAISCLGNESSVFDCDLSPWGVEGCQDHEILALLCGDEKYLLGKNFTITSTEKESLELTDKISNFLGIPTSNRNSATDLVPSFNLANYSFGFCLSDKFGLTEASVLCQSLGYQCGAPDFGHLDTAQKAEQQCKFVTSGPSTDVTVSVSVLVDLSCDGECRYELRGDCDRPTGISCHSSCPRHLARSPLSTHWHITLREDVSPCMEIFLGSVNIVNKLSLGSTVRVATTVVQDEEEAVYEAGLEERGEKCVRRLMTEVCGCLAWHHNSRLEQVTCQGEQLSNCSQSVSRLWSSAGGDCRAAVRLTGQILRVSLQEEELCEGCQESGAGTRVTHHVTHSSRDCEQERGLTLVRDRQASATFTRHNTNHWLHSLASFGGLWSLLTGLSVLSVLELLYWFLSRLYNPDESQDRQDSQEAPAFALVDTGEVQDVLVITDLTEEEDGQNQT